jgi:hypothetical protein
MKRNKVLKILTVILALVLISGVLFITNVFVGNPVSAKIAEKAIRNYINEKYSSLDLELEKPIYDPKSGSYIAWAKSKTSIDTKFSINYRNGEIYHDSYEFDVLHMHNTLRRLEDEYTYIAGQILEDELGYGDDSARVMYDKDDYENAGHRDTLKLDMEFSRSLPLNPEISLSLKGIEDVSLENISKILIDSYETFLDNECYFKKYGMYAGDNGTVVTVYGVTPEDIEGGQLLGLLQQAKDHRDDIVFEKNGDKIDDGNGITIFVKTK